MRFLHIAYMKKEESFVQVLQNRSFRRVHQGAIEHHIVEWMRRNLPLLIESDGVSYYDFSKEQVQTLYDAASDALAEKVKDSPRPWKYLPVPDREEYPYQIAQYEYEYSSIYYESVYKYVNVLTVILNIFDFDQNRLIAYV